MFESSGNAAPYATSNGTICSVLGWVYAALGPKLIILINYFILKLFNHINYLELIEIVSIKQ